MFVSLLTLAEILKCMNDQAQHVNTTCKECGCNAALCIFNGSCKLDFRVIRDQLHASAVTFLTDSTIFLDTFRRWCTPLVELSPINFNLKGLQAFYCFHIH